MNKPLATVRMRIEEARALIRKAVGNPDADVHFLVGGTQTNSTVIRALFRNYQGVVCAETGHITGHEGGAVEAEGHKVFTMPAENGKISVEQLEVYLERFKEDGATDQLMQPGGVYISHPTEYDTLSIAIFVSWKRAFDL